MLLLALAAGAGRYQAARPHVGANDLAWYNDRGSARLVGVISAPPERRDRTTLLWIDVEEITPLGAENPAGLSQAVHGRLLAQVTPDALGQYGDRVALTGRPQTPPELEDFSYRAYLARQGIYTYLPYARVQRLESGQGNPLLAAIYALRQRAYRTLVNFFPQPEAGLLAGILLGIESDIPPSLKEAFQATGTSHIIAISGFNIAILAGLFSALAGRFLRHFRALIFTLVGIAFYTVLVGAQPSVVRAALMGGLGLLGAQIGRRQSGSNTLAFTAALMSLFDPNLPWDVGFQLSFAATLGLILYAQPLQDGFARLAASRLPPATAQRLVGPISEYLLFTLAAQVTTLPILVYHFGRISLSALLANPLILPPQPAVMILGGVAVLVGMVLPGLGRRWPTSPGRAGLHIRLTELLANCRAARSPGRQPPGAGLCSTCCSSGLPWGRRHRLVVAPRSGQAPERSQRWRWGAGRLALATVFAWQNLLAVPNGRLQVRVMDVSGGPALLVKGPHGGAVLINGSNRASELSSRLSRSLPLTQRRLDGLVITAPAASTLEGLPGTLERFPTRWVWWDATAGESQATARLAEALDRQGVTPLTPAVGQGLALGAESRLEVLALSEQGCALLLEWNHFRLLIAGGVPLTTLQRRAPERLAGLTALVLSEGDLKHQTLSDWGTLAPLAILPAGSEITAAGAIQTLQPPAGGWVSLATDGLHLWLARGQ